MNSLQFNEATWNAIVDEAISNANKGGRSTSPFGLYLFKDDKDLLEYIKDVSKSTAKDLKVGGGDFIFQSDADHATDLKVRSQG